MCKKLIALISFVLVLGFSSGIAQGADPSLVGWWRFDEGTGTTAYDSSIYGNDGTLQNGPQWVNGKLKMAMQFDGVDDFVQVPHDPILTVDNEVTVMAWINTSRHGGPGTEDWQGILAKSNDPRSYSFYTESGGGLHFSTAGTGTVSSTQVPLNEWVHVCAMVSAGQHIYYINGQPAGTGGSGIVLPGATDTASVTIGRTQEGATRSFLGMIDDARIYNRALTQEEVQEAMLGADTLQARNPNPAHLAVDVPVGVNLSWTRGDYAIQDEVYFGTDPCMANLPKIATLLSAVHQPLIDLPADLIASTTYYWYVVETDGNAAQHAPDEPWSFTTVLGEAQPKSPADGAIILGNNYPPNPPYTHIYALLEFIPGQTTVSFTGYFSDDYSEVANRDPAAYLGPPPVPQYPYRYYAGLPLIPPVTDSLERGTIYYWAVDSNDASNNEFPGDVWEFTILGYYAYAPNPPNEATFVNTDVLLSWRKGAQVDEHDVYMGTSWEDVNNARYNPGVQPPEFLVTRTEPNLMVTGLPLEVTQYWRVDEILGRYPPPIGGGTYYYGPVWKFTTHGPITGLTGEYYHQSPGASPAGFETKMLVRVDPEIDFAWASGGPDPVMSTDYFSVRWTGRIAVPAVGTYTFTTETDDGVRLWINDTLVIDQWIDQGVTAHSGSIQLNSFGPHDIKMEYYENAGGAEARLNWAGPSVPYGVVPSNYLAPNNDAFTAANPRPRDGYPEPNPQPTLTWTLGAFAATHELYFSSDFNDVNERTASKIVLSAASYAFPAQLDMGETYYWAVDEVNGVGPAPGFWPGDVWSFTIPPGGTGRAIREWWLSIGSGTAITDLTNNARYPDWPTGWEYVSLFEGPVDWADNYGSRISGWLRPPTTGDYTFWIATDDPGVLNLSTDEDPNNAVEIASVSGWVGSRDWDNGSGQGGPNQQSAAIPLEVGKKYYIEAMMKEGGGGDNIAVAWQGPAPVATRDVIDGRYLCATPYDPPYASVPNPANGSIVEDRTPLLSWWPGVFTQATNGHRVYFSANRDDVNDRNPAAFRGITTEPNYPVIAPLDLNRTYYWCVDEVSSTSPPPGLWYGRLWRFTMAECISLDNFEDYNDRNELRVVWTDGYASVIWGGTYPFQYLIQGGSNGSNLNVSSAGGSPTGGTGPIHTGLEAMVLRYDNDGFTYTGLPGAEKWVYTAPYFSEIEADTTGPGSLDVGTAWSSEGVKSITMWFQGHPISDGFYDATKWPAYTITGRGRDIQGRHDEFYFLSQYPLTSPGTIQVQVYDMENTNPWSKAGVMIREKWTPYSKYAAVYMTPGNGVSFEWRQTEDGPVQTINKTGITVPQYVKLERSVSGSFIAKHSSNGLLWQDVNDAGESPIQPLITMGDAGDPNLYIGTVVTSHDALATCTADFNNVLAAPSPTNWVFGNIGTNNPEQLYMALSDGTNTAVVNHPDPNAATLTEWQEWNILLTDFGGINLNNIQKVYIGLGDRLVHPDPGGSGTIYVDDLRACPPRCVPEYAKPQADIATPYDCIVDEKDLAALAADYLMRDELIVTSPPSDVNKAAHYMFEGNYLDSSLHLNHLTDPCGSAPGFAAGVVGTLALDLDGVDDWLVVDGNVGIDGNVPRTIACWAKANSSSISDWTNVFGFTNSLTSGQGGRSFDIEIVGATTSPGSTTSGYFGLHVYGWEYDIMANDQDWHHFAGTYDGTTIRWYGDGIELGSADRQLNTLDNVQTGKRGDNANNFPGLVDDARIYNVALSESEIAYLATQGAPTLHIPIPSVADLYQGEPQGSQWINLKDYGVMTGSWLETILWP